MEPEMDHKRRRFTYEFKLKAVNLSKKRGVAQPSSSVTPDLTIAITTMIVPCLKRPAGHSTIAHQRFIEPTTAPVV